MWIENGKVDPLLRQSFVLPAERYRLGLRIVGRTLGPTGRTGQRRTGVAEAWAAKRTPHAHAERRQRQRRLPPAQLDPHPK